MARTRYATSGGVRIGYELRGRLHRRRPWLVLVHGLGFDRSGWDPVSRQLRRHFRLALVDNRGIGRSDVPAGQFGVADMARDVVAVLDAARIRRTHVIGASLGGMVAQELAIEYPDRVDRLVLACTTPGWPSGYPMPPASAQLLAASGGLPPAVALRRQVDNALSARTVRQRPEVVDRLVRHHRSRPVDPRGWQAQLAAGARYVGGMRQTRIRSPTLILHGEADAVVDPRNSQLLASRIPRSRVALLPDRGHLFFWEDPEGFIAAVIPFLLACTRSQQHAVSVD
jgi:3-oxoadipate enol-lactonase